MKVQDQHQIKPNTQSCQTSVSGSTVYPLAFLTRANKLFMKSKTDFSGDGTPRYIPNPKASGTYCLQDCMKDYTPIYDRRFSKSIV